MKIIRVFLLAWCWPTFASTNLEVIYFGGYDSTDAQMQCWESGTTGTPGVEFRGVAYPAGAGAGAASAVKAGASVIKQAVAEIDANPSMHYVIIGHSSGAALSNQVASEVKDPTHVELVDLDGFSPSASLQKKMKTECWYALNPSNGLFSLNASSIKSNCTNVHSYQDTTCKTKWCLHFSLVNKAAPFDLSSSTFATQGYLGCATNLDWMTNL
jgi:hypothetical protein